MSATFNASLDIPVFKARTAAKIVKANESHSAENTRQDCRQANTEHHKL